MIWGSARGGVARYDGAMTAFVESCLETVAGSAVAAERRARGRPRAIHLLAALERKRNILITTHLHPDPDALGSALALRTLLEQKLEGRPAIDLSIKGTVGGGLNDAFLRLGKFHLTGWDDAALGNYD